MGPREAAVALELLGVDKCIPCHYGTFPLLTRHARRAAAARAERRRARARARARRSPSEVTAALVRGARAAGVPRSRSRASTTCRSTRRSCSTTSATTAALREAFDAGTARRRARRTTPRACVAALARPEVSCVLVPADKRELLDLDLVALTYGDLGSRPTRSPPATSRRGSGAWPCSRSSSPPAPSSPGPSPEPGAVATQAYANPRYGPDGLALLREGRARRRPCSD